MCRARFRLSDAIFSLTNALDHQGIILLRDGHVTLHKKIAMLINVLSLPEDKIIGNFIVVTETAIRITSAAKDAN